MKVNATRKFLVASAAICIGVVTTLAQPAMAAPVNPLSYGMLNGNTGSYNYWDESYTGVGCTTCDNAPLSGGLGDLTDGVVATDNWFVTEAPPGNGPYVGWLLDPTITFHFAPLTAVDSISIYYDDANGAGGVSTPAAFVINGTSYGVVDAPGSAPNVFTVSGLGFVGDTFTVTAVRNNAWVFLSEVSFASKSGAVPEPATWALMIGGFGMTGAAMRRRRTSATFA